MHATSFLISTQTRCLIGRHNSRAMRLKRPINHLCDSRATFLVATKKIIRLLSHTSYLLERQELLKQSITYHLITQRGLV